MSFVQLHKEGDCIGSRTEVPIGTRSGRLTLIREIEPKAVHRIKRGKPYIEMIRMCECKCDCGRTTITQLRFIREKKVSACRYCCNSKPIRHETKGDITIIYTSNGRTALIDTEDLPKVLYHAFWSDKNGYIKTTINQKTRKLHDIILYCPKGMVIDHINHNPSDNRKCNLRVCTQSQNSCNRRGVKGVYQQKGKWIAAIGLHGKSIFLGQYNTREEAIVVRKEAEIKYFGEFRYKEHEDVLAAS